jgi:hypothetical protein
MFIGPLCKVAYAFLWQEYFIPLNFAYGYIGLHLQAWITTPIYNRVVNFFSTIEQSDENLIDFNNVYPGDRQCRVTSPHAIWHEESANGLMETVFLADKMN